MTHDPEFIDNRDGNTLDAALKQLLQACADGGMANAGTRPSEVAIAAAFFSPTGLVRLAPHIAGLDRVRLLFGIEAPRDVEQRRPKLGETPEQFDARLLREGVREVEAAERMARDRFPFTRERMAALRKLVDTLHGQNVEMRRYERAFLHAKAYIAAPPAGVIDGRGAVIVGSSNLTNGGLSHNLELNLGRFDEPMVQKARAWFDALWDEAMPIDLAAPLEEIFAEYTPWQIFLRILFQLYGNEVAELEKEDRGLPLTSFQAHGVARALRLLRDRSGCIVADEVGLGKTFIAGEIIRLYRANRQRTLLLCPAQLRDTTWKKFLNRFEFDRGVECLSYEQLANDIQLNEHGTTHLQSPLDDYQLIVVDEAHNYRNPDAATRAAVLRRLLFGRARDLLMLTATPVNNSLWDLFYLIRYFARQDAFLADRGVLSVYERFHQAMRVDPSNLSPDLLYPIIDATCVKRTRQFVKKHYAGDTIKGPDGRDMTIVFPEPQAISVRYRLDEPLPELFDAIEAALDPEGKEALTFARYRTGHFLKSAGDAESEAQTAATVGLISSGLLKRFESSAYAFRRTLDTLIRAHEHFLDALDRGQVVNTRFLRELADSEETLDDLLHASVDALPSRLFKVPSLEAAVRTDLEKLVALRRKAAKITPDRDPKLRILEQELEKIAAQAKEEAVGPNDEQQRRKVLLFSFFADTVEYIRDFLQDAVKRNPRLKAFRGRVVAVSGDDDLGEGVSRQEAIYGFAPVSTEAPPARKDDLYDILVTTDVLAEGVNLQQCRNIINLDVPWNPMRLVQRHGRIDRIGSPHSRVFLRTIFPAGRLDQLLNLEQRILNKIAMAAASIGVVSPVVGAAHGQQVFTETREEIERLLREDPSLYERGGTVGAAQTGEEYRQTLRKALAENREAIVSIPWKAGSGMAKGKERGVLFCAAVGDRTFLRFVPAGNSWRVSGGEQDIVGELGTCLRLIECEPQTPRLVPRQLEADRIFDLWAVAQAHILKAWMIETDPANLQPRLRPLNLRVAEYIRANSPADIEAARLRSALDILESPWPRREEMMLREWFDDEKHSGAAKSAVLIDRILETGLEPFREPPVLPPIRADEIELVCWMALTPDL